MTATESRGSGTAGGSRQTLVLGLCAVGVVVAGLAAPAAGPPPEAPQILLGSPERNCQVALNDRPVPGRPLTVTVTRNGSTVQGAPVWYNDERVGRTNASGRVTGQVPYARWLNIRVQLENSVCRFQTDPVDPRDTESDGGFETETEPAPDGPGIVTDKPASGGEPGTTDTAALGPSVRPAQFGGDGENESGRFLMPYQIRIAVEDDPYPGDRVTLRAVLEDDPVPNASVTVGGQAVGRTDDEGRISIRIPDDRTRYLPVRVEKGELAGRQRINVLLLQVDVRGSELVAWPGQDGAIVATVGGRPTEDVRVSVDGAARGNTSENGTVPMALPADPTTTVTVQTDDQTARTTLFPTYAPLAAVVAALLFALVVVPAVTYRYGGPAGIAALVGLAVGLTAFAAGVHYVGAVPTMAATAGLLALASAYWYAGVRGVATLVAVGAALGAVALAFEFVGPVAALVVAAALALLGLVAFAVHLRVGRAGRTLHPRSFARSLQGSVTSGALRLTRNVEGLLDAVGVRLRRVWARVADRSARGAIRGAVAWVRALPRRSVAALWWVVRSPWRVLALLRESDDEGGQTAVERDTGTTTTRADESAGTIREMWRAFARQVVPDRWRHRTPGEVSRRARDQGHSREPVEELTRVFRDVEYGGKERSADRHQRARTAFETLRNESEEESDR